MRIVVVAYIPSPYQVEFFDAIARQAGISLAVIYGASRSRERLWRDSTPRHDSLCLDQGASAAELVRQWIAAADLVVVNGYQTAAMRSLMRWRAQTSRPWCFWGERPGAMWPRPLGKIARRFLLSPLRDPRVPVWGVGEWAVRGYRSELGARQFHNLPYFSSLARFAGAARRHEQDAHSCRFLYSGSLIRRKGVDLLAQSFLRIANAYPHARLDVVGAGGLRPAMERILAPCAQRVRFHGFRQWDELPDVYARSDVLCVPSRYDGWGLVVAEGLAAGLPVIATDRTGAALDLIGNDNGWMISAGQLDPLVAAMQAAVRVSAQERMAMMQAACNSVSRHQLEDGVRRFLEAAEAAVAAWREPQPVRFDASPKHAP